MTRSLWNFVALKSLKFFRECYCRFSQFLQNSWSEKVKTREPPKKPFLYLSHPVLPTEYVSFEAKITCSVAVSENSVKLIFIIIKNWSPSPSLPHKSLQHGVVVNSELGHRKSQQMQALCEAGKV